MSTNDNAFSSIDALLIINYITRSWAENWLILTTAAPDHRFFGIAKLR